MSYVTAQDLVTEFGERELRLLTDRDKTGAIDVTVLQGAQDYADRAVDAHLRALVTVPLTTPVPGEIASIVMDLARYRLYDRGETPRVVRDRFDHAMRMLRDYRDGKLSLPAGLDDASAVASEVEVLKDDDDRKFKVGDTWDGFDL